MKENFANDNTLYSCGERLTEMKENLVSVIIEVCKNHYKKENISVGSSAQRKNALF